MSRAKPDGEEERKRREKKRKRKKKRGKKKKIETPQIHNGSIILWSEHRAKYKICSVNGVKPNKASHRDTGALAHNDQQHSTYISHHTHSSLLLPVLDYHTFMLLYREKHTSALLFHPPSTLHCGHSIPTILHIIFFILLSFPFFSLVHSTPFLTFHNSVLIYSHTKLYTRHG